MRIGRFSNRGFPLIHVSRGRTLVANGARGGIQRDTCLTSRRQFRAP